MASQLTVLLIVTTTVVLCLTTTDAYPSNGRRVQSGGLDEYEGNGPALNAFARSKWCARWGETCVQDSKVVFARCCSGLRCVCGAFWAQNKCECKSSLSIG